MILWRTIFNPLFTRTIAAPALMVLALAVMTPPFATAKVLLERGAWQAIKDSENANPVCAMSAAPEKSVGKYTKRGTVLAIVSHRPREKRFGEVSFQAGYSFKPGSKPTATIDGKKTFKLFTQGNYAWAFDAKSDRALIAAMRAGNQLIVTGTSSRGTKTTDTYSLKGFSAAFKAISKACGVK